MFAAVDETVGTRRRSHDMEIGHREEAEVAAADLDAGVRRAGDAPDAHHGDSAPRRIGGEEAPVIEHVARCGIGDVVRGDRKRLKLKQHLAIGQLGRWLGGERTGVAEIGAVYVEVHVGDSTTISDRLSCQLSIVLESVA